MTNSSSPTMSAWLKAGLLFVVAVALVLGGKALGFTRDPVGAGLLSAVLCVAATPLMVVYWRHLDEVAKEAHKFAWYWGGSAGLVAIMIAFTVLMAPGSHIVTAEFLGADQPKDLLAIGMLATVLSQVIGYFVAWVGWWIARR